MAVDLPEVKRSRFRADNRISIPHQGEVLGHACPTRKKGDSVCWDPSGGELSSKLELTHRFFIGK